MRYQVENPYGYPQPMGHIHKIEVTNLQDVTAQGHRVFRLYLCALVDNPIAPTRADGTTRRGWVIVADDAGIPIIQTWDQSASGIEREELMLQGRAYQCSIPMYSASLQYYIWQGTEPLASDAMDAMKNSLFHLILRMHMMFRAAKMTEVRLQHPDFKWRSKLTSGQKFMVITTLRDCSRSSTSMKYPYGDLLITFTIKVLRHLCRTTASQY